MGKIIECYEKNEPVMGKIVSKCKGGAIVEHIDTGSLMFLLDPKSVINHLKISVT